MSQIKPGQALPGISTAADGLRPRSNRLAVVHRITGLIDGKYIAAFTVPDGDEHQAYAKTTTSRPGCVWDGTPGSNWMSAGPFLESVTAMAIIIDLAAESIGDSGKPPL